MSVNQRGLARLTRIISVVASLITGLTVLLVAAPPALAAESLDAFVSSTSGTTQLNPYSSGCVALVEDYLDDVYGYTTTPAGGHAWGNAYQWAATSAGGNGYLGNLGWTWSTDTNASNFHNGDVLVWGSGDRYSGGYGHIAIWYNGKAYWQNPGAAALYSFGNSGTDYVGRWITPSGTGGGGTTPPPPPSFGPVPGVGDLSRYNNGVDHQTSTAGVGSDYHLETTLGQVFMTSAVPGTRALYECAVGSDTFTSPDSKCENQKFIRLLGWIFTSAHSSPPTVPVYRCTAADHFDSNLANCEGAHTESLLGYAVAVTTLARYNNGVDHQTSTAGVGSDYHLETTLGQVFMTSAVPGTRALYECAVGSDTFTSPDSKCENQKFIRLLGWIFTSAHSSPPTVPVYRCTAADHFDSNLANCEGAHTESLLGYAVAVTTLARYNNGVDHQTSTAGVGSDYHLETTLGQVFMTSAVPGTRALYECAVGSDTFTSPDSKCENQKFIRLLGWIFTSAHSSPPTVPVYRCTADDHFDSNLANCEGAHTESLLGYAVTGPPTLVAQPAVRSARLPDGKRKHRYFTRLTGIGGRAPYLWTRIRGTMPPGLSLGPQGELAGVPTRAGTYKFTIRLTDSYAPTLDATRNLQIRIR